MVRSAECGGSPLANALSVKDVVELPEEVPQGVNPRVASLTHPKRCGGTSLGLPQAGPAYTPDSAMKNLEKFDARPRVEPTASAALLSDRSHV